MDLRQSVEKLFYENISGWVSILEDEDLTNSCTKDCAGQWGGLATTDACGVCGSGSADGCVVDEGKQN